MNRRAGLPLGLGLALSLLLAACGEPAHGRVDAVWRVTTAP